MYLLAYNAASAIFWGAVLLKVVKIGSAKGLESALAGGKVYEGTEEFARLVQSAAVLEVVHSLVGMLSQFYGKNPTQDHLNLRVVRLPRWSV